jgi:predicted transcriptional regulator
LEKEFERAREKTPKNVPNQIARNRNKGYIMKADEEKDKKTAYCLTNKGITFVENNFSEDG